MATQVHSVEAFEGPAVQYTNEDGYPAAYVLAVVVARVGGKLFQLPNGLKVGYDDEGFQVVRPRFTLSKAREMVDAIYERGANLEHFVEVTEDDLRDYVRGGYYA